VKEARENGEIGDEAYDRYAETAEENGEEKEEETFKVADDDVGFNAPPVSVRF
jgi:Swi5-dependent recombination DNA repair protein 1